MARFDLNCPFADKDEAKALGARWDAKKRTWYVEGIEDLTPFSKWIPRFIQNRKAKQLATRTTGTLAHTCDCDVPPWEDCEHTDQAVERHRLQLLSQWNHSEARMH